ncbi:hypothetical protein L596_010890 [Steinernema carpocapsae]|uniref:Uncharacterized protein n=1 Tax=Steinernema carpocapsae TaxID=34508 RepID=A0A4U5PJW9_STECR|nr:hypothetical protein L596_010890 [Steinernema carpocapsae]
MPVSPGFHYFPRIPLSCNLAPTAVKLLQTAPFNPQTARNHLQITRIIARNHSPQPRSGTSCRDHWTDKPIRSAL